MVAWAAETAHPSTIVDPGAGSGRFLFAAARAFPDAELLAVEIDPLAAQILRTNAAVLGLTARLDLHVADYRTLSLPEIRGPTLFLGNPPYVRHHDIPPKWKNWLRCVHRFEGHDREAEHCSKGALCTPARVGAVAALEAFCEHRNLRTRTVDGLPGT